MLVNTVASIRTPVPVPIRNITSTGVATTPTSDDTDAATEPQDEDAPA